MLHRAGSEAKERERAQQVFEQTLEVAKTQAHAEGGRWAVVISLLALILSGISLFETVLKQARPVVHVGAVMHYARDADGVEVFAVPITITNNGAREAVIAALDLRVLPAQAGLAAAFASAYAGTGSNPAVHFALSPAAQPVIESAGYVNQAIASWSADDTRARISSYVAAPPQEPGLDRDARVIRQLREAADRTERLSISFRFRSNITMLDTKAWQDVIRLAEHMKTAVRNRRILLVGFADSQGSFAANLALSRARAHEVRTSLLSSGAGLSADLIVASGHSELMPVACNADEAGRAKNRRVEVWLAAR